MPSSHRRHCSKLRRAPSLSDLKTEEAQDDAAERGRWSCCVFFIKCLQRCLGYSESNTSDTDDARIRDNVRRTSSTSSKNCRRRVGHSSCQPHIFTLDELKSATGNFNPDSLLGEGIFGRVHKGCIKENGATAVSMVVKTLRVNAFQQPREWMGEVCYLSFLNHPNLIKLIGYCNEGSQRFLAYEFMARGSLERNLFCRDAGLLPWALRLKIMLGAAEGLSFLHEKTKIPIIYGEFKSSNILLDMDYKAKLSNFGPDNVAFQGSNDYAAPECPDKTGHLTTKSDVYGFGVVLLEILTGKRAHDNRRRSRARHLVDWAAPYIFTKHKVHQLADPRLKGKFSIICLQTVALLAYFCLNKDPNKRPLMSEVVRLLKSIITFQDLDKEEYFPTIQEDHEYTFSNDIFTKESMLALNSLLKYECIQRKGRRGHLVLKNFVILHDANVAIS